MGVHERRERERHELRQRILLAAREIAAREGWPAVTIRRVAERVEYSPPTMYEYFDSKEAILQELVREGCRLLRADMERVRATTPDLFQRTHNLVRTYWNFAWQCPELYRLMYGLDAPVFGMDATPPEAREVMAIVRLSIRELAESTGAPFTETSLDAIQNMVWGTLHGMVSLTMSGWLKEDRERAELLADEALQSIVAVWLGVPPEILRAASVVANL